MDSALSMVDYRHSHITVTITSFTRNYRDIKLQVQIGAYQFVSK